MWPTLLKLGSFEITTFGLMMFLAFLGGGVVLAREFRRSGLSDDHASSVVVAAALGGVLGAKIYYALLYRSWDALLSRGGLVWYGGLIGGFLAVTWYLKRNRIGFFTAADCAAPPLAIGYSIGRVGCFLVGDDYGRPTDSWVGIAFPRGLPPTTAYELRRFGVAIDPALPADTLLKVHPTQIYEALAALAMFLLLLAVRRRDTKPGFAFGLFLVMLGIERFLVEILRAKDDRLFGPFTVAQVISVAIVIAGAGLMARRSPAREALT